MTKDQLALKIHLAMHMPPHTRLDTFNAYLNTHKCLCNYFQYLSMDKIAVLAHRYDVEV